MATYMLRYEKIIIYSLEINGVVIVFFTQGLNINFVKGIDIYQNIYYNVDNFNMIKR